MKIARFPKYKFKEDGSVVSFVKKTPRTLKPIRMGNYVGLQLLRDDGAQEKIYLHRAICEAKNGPCPQGMECRHLDGDKANNAASNLKWGTILENALDRVEHGTSGAGESNSMAVLTEQAVAEMRKIRNETGESYKKIADKFNISTMTAFRAITGESWSHVK
ncbi:HNH nuclease [Vibrio phage 1.162.O._10N.261.48.E3]|nr:HNH nuclease [Vibrio phage 1.147.O._10N.286.49.E9]AUR91710.1 HNH nuclease [Vibrio phage 1.162.O._10N.261.48.E3]